MKNYKYMVNPQREIQRILPFSSCIVFLSLIMPCPLDQVDSMLPDLLVSSAGLHFGLCWNDGCSGKERFMVQLWRSEVCHVILQANCILLGTLDSSQLWMSQSHCICYSFDLKFWVLNRLGQGRDKALQYLRENPLLCSEVEKVCLITFGSYMWIVILSLDRNSLTNNNICNSCMFFRVLHCFFIYYWICDGWQKIQNICISFIIIIIIIMGM